MTEPTLETICYWLMVAELEFTGRRTMEHGVAPPAFQAAHKRLRSQAQREAQLLTELASAQARIAQLETELAMVGQAVPL